MPADTGTAAAPDAPPVGLRLQILGPLRVWRDGVEVDVGPSQQGLLLAGLLARAGRPAGTDELIAMIWGEGPPRARSTRSTGTSVRCVDSWSRGRRRGARDR